MARDENGSADRPVRRRGRSARRDPAARVAAFAEDPLRVLRVARFAARFGFKVARETVALMRELSASGELAALAPERVWQELSRGLMEPHPSRMIEVLRACGALARLLPEVDARFAAASSRRSKRGFAAHLNARSTSRRSGEACCRCATRSSFTIRNLEIFGDCRHRAQREDRRSDLRATSRAG
jgi:tRNA nucleotidyltransferase/poly(A) polymerase